MSYLQPLMSRTFILKKFVPERSLDSRQKLASLQYLGHRMSQPTSRPSLVHQRLKPRRTRVKTGCLPCRLRRKKCDEGKPICSGCKRNHLICSQAPGSQSQDPSSYKGSAGQLDAIVPLAESFPASSQAALNGPAFTMKHTSGGAKSYTVESCIKSSTKSHRKHCDQGPNQQTSLAPSGQLLSDMFGTATLIHPSSRILFEHYVHETADRLSIIQGPENPFITCVMPLARSDAMVMDGVLALSGAHLCYTMQGSDMKSISSTHYALAVRRLKHELTRVATGEPTDPVQLLLTILLLTTTEAVSGNSQGATFHHLRACSHFIPSILAADPNRIDHEIHAFLLETYAYMVSIANITVNTQPTYRALILDPCISSLERFQSSKTSGMMFGYARNLITLIPSICSLGNKRLLEENSKEHSFESVATYKALQLTIQSWQEPSHIGNSKTDLMVAAKIYKEATLMFLHTTFYASNVTDPQLLALIDTSIDAILPLVDSSLDVDSPVMPIMLWPCMIIGSCLRQPEQREYLRHRMLESPFNMTIVQTSVQLLDWLWEDGALDAYGPYGLGSVMKKHGIMYSMS